MSSSIHKATFVYRPEMGADEIPSERIDPASLGIPLNISRNEFTRVGRSQYHLFPPASRLVLALIFARAVFGEDAPGGWIKLGQALTMRFDLKDRYVRRRAVARLERQGVVEAQRQRGACTFLRLVEPQPEYGR